MTRAEKEAKAKTARRERLAASVLAGLVVSEWRSFAAELAGRRAEYREFLGNRGGENLLGTKYSLHDVLGYLRKGRETAEGTLARILNTRAQAEKTMRGS